MGSRCFVICDKEQAYADGLALLLAKKIDFPIHVCSSIEQIDILSKEKGIEILLIGESYPREKYEGIPVREKIILAEDHTFDEEEKKIYKYQSGDAILEEVMAICLEENSSGMFKQQLYKESCVIGVYSPVHRIGKTEFSIALGKELARKERVLYLNLEEYSGWKQRFSKDEQYTLADVLYYARQEQSNLGVRLGMMTDEMDGLEYIAPMYISEDLKKVTSQEWKDLLEQLLGLKLYKKIIIDFGECVQGLWQLLEMCQKIYMPVNHQQESKAKIAQFEKNAEILGHGELWKKMTQLEFDGDMGSYVRQLLQKEEAENDTGRAVAWKNSTGDRPYGGSGR